MLKYWWADYKTVIGPWNLLNDGTSYCLYCLEEGVIQSTLIQLESFGLIGFFSQFFLVFWLNLLFKFSKRMEYSSQIVHIFQSSLLLQIQKKVQIFWIFIFPSKGYTVLCSCSAYTVLCKSKLCIHKSEVHI